MWYICSLHSHQGRGSTPCAGVSRIAGFVAGDIGVLVGYMEILPKNWIRPAVIQMRVAVWIVGSCSCCSFAVSKGLLVAYGDAIFVKRTRCKEKIVLLVVRTHAVEDAQFAKMPMNSVLGNMIPFSRMQVEFK